MATPDPGSARGRSHPLPRHSNLYDSLLTRIPPQRRRAPPCGGPSERAKVQMARRGRQMLTARLERPAAQRPTRPDLVSAPCAQERAALQTFGAYIATPRAQPPRGEKHNRWRGCTSSSSAYAGRLGAPWPLPPAAEGRLELMFVRSMSGMSSTSARARAPLCTSERAAADDTCERWGCRGLSPLQHSR